MKSTQKTAIQAIKKGAGKSGSPTQERRVKKLWNPGGSQEIAVMVSLRQQKF